MFEDLLNSLNPFKKKIDVAPFEITCIIDGKNFNLWTNAEITIPFDGVSHFSISCPFDHKQKSFRDLFRPFTYKEIELYVNGDLKLTGYFITPKPAGSESSATMTIDGYGKCGILEDVCADPESWPVSFNGLTLPKIIDKLGKQNRKR
jgi:prophage tail gpP-like protein